MSGQDSSRGLSIKGQASDLEVLVQTLGLGNRKGVGTKHWVQGTAQHREGVSIAIGSSCSSKKWAENTFVGDLLHARYCVYNIGAY